MSKTLTVNSYAKIKCPHGWVLQKVLPSFLKKPLVAFGVCSHINKDEALVSPHPLFSLRTVLSIHMASSAWNYHLFKTHLNTTAPRLGLHRNCRFGDIIPTCFLFSCERQERCGKRKDATGKVMSVMWDTDQSLTCFSYLDQLDLCLGRKFSCIFCFVLAPT